MHKVCRIIDGWVGNPLFIKQCNADKQNTELCLHYNILAELSFHYNTRSLWNLAIEAIEML